MRLRAATLSLIALLALAGCGGGGEGTRVRREGLPPAGGGGTLGYALPSLPSTLDPLAARTREAQTVTRQVYEPLIERLTGPYTTSAPQPGASPACCCRPEHGAYTRSTPDTGSCSARCARTRASSTSSASTSPS